MARLPSAEALVSECLASTCGFDRLIYRMLRADVQKRLSNFL
jgi:hypothetical protein